MPEHATGSTGIGDQLLDLTTFRAETDVVRAIIGDSLYHFFAVLLLLATESTAFNDYP